jgi:hypothetical protein
VVGGHAVHAEMQLVISIAAPSPSFLVLFRFCVITKVRQSAESHMHSGRDAVLLDRMSDKFFTMPAACLSNFRLRAEDKFVEMLTEARIRTERETERLAIANFTSMRSQAFDYEPVSATADVVAFRSAAPGAMVSL